MTSCRSGTLRSRNTHVRSTAVLHRLRDNSIFDGSRLQEYRTNNQGATTSARPACTADLAQIVCLVNCFAEREQYCQGRNHVRLLEQG